MTEQQQAAMRQALEALEVCEQSDYGRKWVWPDTAHPTAMGNVREAITALRQALEQQPANKPDYSICPTCGGMASDPIVPLSERHADEPVAWMYFRSCLNDDGTQTSPWVKHVSQFKPFESIIHRDITPLYTRPQPAAWVGIDDDEIHSIGVRMLGVAGYGGNTDRDFARAIEAKLREKNAKPAAPSERWCPDVCPITGLPFFMWIEHHETGEKVPTYGGPYDSYTIPVRNDSGEYVRERYDHDRGGWLTDEIEDVGVQIVSDQAFVYDDERPQPAAQWVGLTLEDKQDYMAQDYGGSRLDAMDWAEAKLREKNGGKA